MKQPRPLRALGVTLLEILVAVAVLAIGLGTVFQIFPMGFAASNQSRNKVIAYELAAQKIEDVRNNFLFGGTPPGSPPDNTKLFMYWGAATSPDPDRPTYAQVNTNGQYKAFSATSLPEKNYFYKVEAKQVIDPGRKYQRELIHDLYVAGRAQPFQEGFATLWRITVTVRGPLQSVAEAQDSAWSQNESLQKKAVEAKLATYVANKAIGDAVLAYDHIKDATGAYANGGDKKNNYLYIKGSGPNGYPYPENFSVFYRPALMPNEYTDTGPAPGISNALTAAPIEGMNGLGLDNVVIFTPSGGQFIAESNKIKGIFRPKPTGENQYPNQDTTYWLLVLAKNLAYNDQDYTNREAHGYKRLLDTNCNGAPTAAGQTGYPTDTTRVRLLMTLDDD